MKRTPPDIKPVVLMLIMMCAIFIGELVIMIVIPVLYGESMSLKVALVDSLVLSVIILPVLYILEYLPMTSHRLKRKETEETLRHTESKLRDIEGLAHLGRWEWDIANDKLWWSDETYRIFGLKDDGNITIEDFLNRIHEDDREHTHSRIKESIANKTGVKLDYRIVCPDGTVKHLLEETVTFTDDSGEVIRRMGTVQDISDIKRAEEEATKSRELLDLVRDAQEYYIVKGSYEKVFSNLLDVLLSVTKSEYGFIDEVLKDENGEPYKLSLAISDISWDDESRELYKKLKNRGLEFRNLKNLSGAPALTGEVVISNSPGTDPRSGGLPKGHPRLDSYMGIPMYFGGELVGVAGIANRKGGYDYQLASLLEPFISTCASIIHAIRKEMQEKSFVTEKMVLQAEAVRASQLASLGELAAGVAHEINNPINGIINYADILKEKYTNKDGKDIAGRIVKEGERIADIVRSLLAFAREGSDKKIKVHLNEILSEVISLIGTQLKKDGITVALDIPDELPEVEVIKRQVAQVILNVISNARYALNQKYPHADKLKVLEITGREVAHQGRPYVRLTVRDSGTGIPVDIIDKVANPFFTTKPTGEGTGLGLSISQSIMDEQKGRFALESEAGEYTKVIIDLPAVGSNGG